MESKRIASRIDKFSAEWTKCRSPITITPVLPSYWQITQHNCFYNRSGTWRQQVKVHRTDRLDNHILTLYLICSSSSIPDLALYLKDNYKLKGYYYLFRCCVACFCAQSIVSVVETLSKLKLAAAGTELA